MSENLLTVLDWDTLVCFVKGLIKVAKVDGIQAKEREYIEAFFHEETSHIHDKENQDMNFDELANSDFDLESSKNLLNTTELKTFFLKSCIMLACVDAFSDDEKTLITQFSEQLSFNQEQLQELISEVQNEIMAHFKDIQIYSDSLKDVAQSIGVVDY